jgi:hypothetical protein
LERSTHDDFPSPPHFAPGEGNAATEPVPVAPALPVEDTVNDKERVFTDEADELELEIGDLATCAPASALDQPVRVRLTPRAGRRGLRGGAVVRYSLRHLH